MKGCKDEPLQPHATDLDPPSTFVSSLQIARDINKPVPPLTWKSSKPDVNGLNALYDNYYGRASTETASSLSIQTPNTSTISLHNLPKHDAKTSIPHTQFAMRDEGTSPLPHNSQVAARGKHPYNPPVPPVRRTSIARGSTIRILASHRESKEYPSRASFGENNDVTHSPFRPLRLKGKNLASDKRHSVSSEMDQVVRMADHASVNSERRWSVASSKRSSVTSMKLDQNGMRPLSLVKRSATRVCVDTVPEVDVDPLSLYGYSAFAAGLR